MRLKKLRNWNGESLEGRLENAMPTLQDSCRESFCIDTLLPGDSHRLGLSAVASRRANPLCHADSNRPQNRPATSQHVRSWA